MTLSKLEYLENIDLNALFMLIQEFQVANQENHNPKTTP